MKEAIWISIGAVLGANARYFVGGLLSEVAKSTFPVGTLVINISGCAVLGFFMAITTGKLVVDPAWRFLVAVGFCGTYTTFSTFAYESVSLLRDGQWMGFAVNVLATNALCLLGMIAGVKLGS